MSYQDYHMLVTLIGLRQALSLHQDYHILLPRTTDGRGVAVRAHTLLCTRGQETGGKASHTTAS